MKWGWSAERDADGNWCPVVNTMGVAMEFPLVYSDRESCEAFIRHHLIGLELVSEDVSPERDDG